MTREQMETEVETIVESLEKKHGHLSDKEWLTLLSILIGELAVCVRVSKDEL